MRWHRYPHGTAAAEACAAHILERLQRALTTNSRLSGGLRRLLAKEEEIRTVFGLAPGQMPQFDVIHRGIGPEALRPVCFPASR